MPTRKETIAKYRRIIGNTVMFNQKARDDAQRKLNKLLSKPPKDQRRPKQPIDITPDVQAILRRTRERRVKRGASIGGQTC